MDGAQASLTAMFTLGYVCAPDTYEGTIAPSPNSCRIDDAQGYEDFSAQAVGWVSAKTAWLAVGPDDAVVRELVTALQQANG